VPAAFAAGRRSPPGGIAGGARAGLADLAACTATRCGGSAPGASSSCPAGTESLAGSSPRGRCAIAGRLRLGSATSGSLPSGSPGENARSGWGRGCSVAATSAAGGGCGRVSCSAGADRAEVAFVELRRGAGGLSRSPVAGRPTRVGRPGFGALVRPPSCSLPDGPGAAAQATSGRDGSGQPGSAPGMPRSGQVTSGSEGSGQVV